MITGNIFAAFTPNLPGSLAKALSLFLTHSFRPASSLGEGLPPPTPSLPGSTASMSMPIAIPIAARMERIVISCSQNRVWILWANVVSLSNTLDIISLKLVIWLVSLPLRRLMLSCLTDRSSFSLVILRLMSSRIPLSYSGLSQISLSLHFSHSCIVLAKPFLPLPPLVNP